MKGGRSLISRRSPSTYCPSIRSRNCCTRPSNIAELLVGAPGASNCNERCGEQGACEKWSGVDKITWKQTRHILHGEVIGRPALESLSNIGLGDGQLVQISRLATPSQLAASTSTQLTSSPQSMSCPLPGLEQTLGCSFPKRLSALQASSNYIFSFPSESGQNYHWLNI